MGRPVVFIHGLWLHASSWDRWVRLFARRGYAAVAPGWPGDEPTVRAARQRTEPASGRGLSEVGEHYERIATGFPQRPVLIGHGLGGLLALRIAPHAHAAGVIAIEAVLVSARVVTLRAAPAASTVALSRDLFRVVYGGSLSREESDRLCERWAIPAPRWALDDPVTRDAAIPLPAGGAANSSRGPVLLVVSGETGRNGTARSVRDERRLLAADSDVVVFADRGPSLVIDGGWRLVAQSCLSWMDAHEL